MKKTAEEILYNYEGHSPSSDGHGWVEMDSGGSWYHKDKVIEAMEEFAAQDKWISVDVDLPPFNLGVMVFIPLENNHITAGMLDISLDWVLLDEYRTPECEVTHWMELPNAPTK